MPYTAPLCGKLIHSQGVPRGLCKAAASNRPVALAWGIAARYKLFKRSLWVQIEYSIRITLSSVVKFIKVRLECPGQREILQMPSPHVLQI